MQLPGGWFHFGNQTKRAFIGGVKRRESGNGPKDGGHPDRNPDRIPAQVEPPWGRKPIQCATCLSSLWLPEEINNQRPQGQPRFLLRPQRAPVSPLLRGLRVVKGCLFGVVQKETNRTQSPWAWAPYFRHIPGKALLFSQVVSTTNAKRARFPGGNSTEGTPPKPRRS